MPVVGVQNALPSAWYPDPRNNEVLRWWDGSAWTTHVKEIPSEVFVESRSEFTSSESASSESTRRVMTDEPLASEFIIRTSAPELTRSATFTRPPADPRQVEERRGPQLAPPRPVVSQQTGPIYGTAPRAVGQPPRSGSPVHPEARRLSPLQEQQAQLRNSGDINDEIGTGEVKLEAGAASSVEIWAMAAVPVVAFFANFALFHYTEWFQRTPILFWIIPVAALLLSFVLATTDRGRLVGNNVTDAPHAALGFLPPIYLLMRAVQVSAITAVPFLVWGAAALLLYRPVQVLMGAYLQLFATVPA